MVNLATERVSIQYIPTLVGFDAFKRAVTEAGYSVEMLTERFVDRERERREGEYLDLKKQFTVSVILTAPVIVGSLNPCPVLVRHEVPPGRLFCDKARINKHEQPHQRGNDLCILLQPRCNFHPGVFFKKRSLSARVFRYFSDDHHPYPARQTPGSKG